MSCYLDFRCLALEDVGPVTVVRLADGVRLDGLGGQALADRLHDLVDHEGRRELRLDCSGLESLNGKALGKLVTLHQKLRDLGGRLSLVNVSPAVYEIFKVTRLTLVLNVGLDGACMRNGSLACRAV